MSDLAHRQLALLNALVSGADIPEGFDEATVRAAAAALLRKRSGEVGAAWPALRANLGPEWSKVFAAWAAGRRPTGSLRDGWDLARARRSDLNPAARDELAEREAVWRYDGRTAPRRRRLPAMSRAHEGWIVQLAGRRFLVRKGS